MHTTLVIYLKAPVLGFVKTRLAKTLGPERALQIYETLVVRQLSEIPDSVQLEVHYTPTSALEGLQKWIGEDYHYVPQSLESDLGMKLMVSIESVFSRGAEACICIGGDCPGLQHEHIESALAALNLGADVVYGPCTDGGYYLVALKQPQPALFTDIPWSGPKTLSTSLARAKALDLKVHLLETLYDVDDQLSWEQAVNDGLLQANGSNRSR